MAIPYWIAKQPSNLLHENLSPLAMFKLSQADFVEPVPAIASWSELHVLFNSLMEKSMCLCLTKADIGKKFRNRAGKIVEITQLLSHTIYPIRGIVAGNDGETSYTPTGRYFKHEESGSDLIEAVCPPAVAGKSWDSLRKSESCKGVIKSGTWRTLPPEGQQSPVAIEVLVHSHTQQASIVIDEDEPYFTPTELLQLADFCTELAGQLSS